MYTFLGLREKDGFSILLEAIGPGGRHRVLAVSLPLHFDSLASIPTYTQGKPYLTMSRDTRMLMLLSISHISSD